MTESIRYEVMKRLDEVEIRQYPIIILATVSGMSENDAFRILFKYITGENRSHKNLAMTVPVISGGSYSEEIPMTRPVISDGNTFSFVLPNSYSIETAPRPMDERIRIVEMKARKLAVLSFSGRGHAPSVQKNEKVLKEKLEGNGTRMNGPFFLMRYDGPLTIGSLRHNEVAIEVDE